MTITNKYLRDLEKYSRVTITKEEKEIILERFGTEPEPYTWSEQDISVQIRNYLNCGHWEKPMTGYADQEDSLFDDDDLPF